MFYTILADFLVGLHLGYVAFVLIGQLLILLGILCGWQWVRNLRFRVIHLVMLEVVALEGLFGILCPMTTWESDLRALAREANKPAEPPPSAVAKGPEPVPMVEPEPMRVIEQEPAVSVQPPIPQQPASQPPTVQPPAPVEEKKGPEREPQDSTFVGRIIDSVLFLDVPQQVLNKWYVGIGIASLLITLAFPPYRGQWTRFGLTGVVLFWIGLIFLMFMFNIWVLFGVSLILAGVGCGYLGRKYAW